MGLEGFYFDGFFFGLESRFGIIESIILMMIFMVIISLKMLESDVFCTVWNHYMAQLSICTYDFAPWHF